MRNRPAELMSDPVLWSVTSTYISPSKALMKLQNVRKHQGFVRAQAAGQREDIVRAWR